MNYISKSVLIKYGDVIVTSGQGGIFPPGLIVGKVMKSYKSDSSVFQRVIVKPVIDYSLIEDVFVVKKEPDPELLELIKNEN